MNNLAISYRRFSSLKQKLGSSSSRQLEATQDYCKQHGLTLIEELDDKAISGWKGDNLDDTAALGKFLNLVEMGKIAKGTTLIVENLDRITRTQLTKAVNLFTGILVQEIDIVTTMDGRRYTKDSATTDIIIAITILMRGNEESETKSKRVLDAWAKKRAAINRGEFVKMTQHPNWLEVKDGKYVPKKEASKTVQTVFELYASGKGSHVIAKELNKSGVKTYSRSGDTFTFSSIERLLKSASVIGTCDVVEPPKMNYWPAVIKEDLWYKVQALRKQNSHYKGTRNDAQKINFLGGLAFCAKCGGNMVRYSCTGKNGQRYHYLTCRNAKYGEHSLDLAPYGLIQESFIDGIQYNGFLEPFLKAKSDITIRDNTPELEGRLIEINQRIARVTDAIEKTDNAELIGRLTELQTARKVLQSDIDSEKIKVNGVSDSNAAYYELVKSLDTSIEDNTFRLSLRNFLRNIIEKVNIGRDKSRKTFYEIHFKNVKDIVTVELSYVADTDKSYRVSLNDVWQIGAINL